MAWRSDYTDCEMVQKSPLVAELTWPSLPGWDPSSETQGDWRACRTTTVGVVSSPSGCGWGCGLTGTGSCVAAELAV